MIVNPQTLRGIYVGFNTIFNKAFAEQATIYQRLATVVPSTTAEETYAWLGTIPGMREWIGNREVKNLSASSYTIKNRDFEGTIGVPRNDIDDDKLGLYTPSVQMLGQSAALHPDNLVFELLRKGFSEQCYDGKPFFSTDHVVGKNKVSNMSTAPLTKESYIAARAAIMSMTDDKGESLNLIPDTLVVAPANEAAALDIVNADIINGTKNTMAGTAKVLVATQLAGMDTAWFLMCTTRPLKPIIFQQRQKPKFVAKTDEKDDNVFMQKKFLYGVDSRDNVGFGFWQMAYGSTGAGEANGGSKSK